MGCPYFCAIILKINQMDYCLKEKSATKTVASVVAFRGIFTYKSNAKSTKNACENLPRKEVKNTEKP